MTVWEGLAHGFGVALQPDVLIYCLLGVSLGTFIGGAAGDRGDGGDLVAVADHQHISPGPRW